MFSTIIWYKIQFSGSQILENDKIVEIAKIQGIFTYILYILFISTKKYNSATPFYSNL